MFDGKDAGGNVVGGVAVEYRDDALRDNWTAVQFGGYKMDGTASNAAAGFEGAFVGVQAGEGGKDGWVDVDQAVLVMGAEFGCEDAHKTCEDNQIRLVGIDFFYHGLVEIEAAGEVFVVEAVGGDAALGCPSQSGSGCAVAEDGGDAGVWNGSIDDGLHIAAAAGDEDNDVFHGVGLSGFFRQSLYSKIKLECYA